MNFPFMWYKNVGRTFVCFVAIHTCDGRTDRWTDGQTDGLAIRKSALHTTQHGKKYGIPDLLSWFGSCLSNRQQKVHANQSTSSWEELSGAMPQGSWLGGLGTLSFLVLDLCTGCPVDKYVNDATLSEILQPKQ